MYKVLYRKYRPRFFADVVGQPQVTVTLKNELTRGRIAHAYLFTGSRGTGKTTCAKILSRAVNCLDPREGDPCGECPVCRGLEEGSILDVVEIDAASNNGVDNIRGLIEEANFTPTTAKYRVYIIDEVHMLSASAFNALLKTLEEPPSHVIFILATTEVHKLLPTILSRCQRFDFHRIDPQAMAGRLIQVAGLEEAELDEDAALLIARIADGALRDALSLLDQCLGRGRHVTLEVVGLTAGVAAQGYLTTLAQAVAERDAAKALETLDGLHKESKDMVRLCEEMAEYFRSLMLFKTMRDPGKLLTLPPTQIAALEQQAYGMSLSAILHGLDTLEDTLHKMRYMNQRTQLEMAFVRLCSPELDDSTAALLRRIEQLESGVPPRALPPLEEEAPARAEEAAPASPAAEPEPEEIPPVFDGPPAPPAEKPVPAPAPKKPAAPKSQPPVDVEALSAEAQRFRQWPEILQVIRGTTKSVAMAFDGSAAYTSGEYLLIEAPEIAFELLKKAEQRQRMREAVFQVTGRAYKLGPYRPPASKESASADPLEDLLRRAEEAGIPTQVEE